jgi:hypothetical protein
MYTTIALPLFAAVVAGLPASTSTRAVLPDTYVFYQGDGSVAAGWPSKDKWASWDDLWSVNSALMKNTCNWNAWGADNSAAETQAVGDAIKQVATEAGIDERFVLAIVMQESKGCVRAPTTNNGVVNPGLMQSHNGLGSCAGISPCPSSSITQMITDGTTGTVSGDGLKQLVAKAAGVVGNAEARPFYAAARLYNSGSADYAVLGNGLGSTPCYASDVANRLLGWTLAPTTCHA